MQSAIDSAVRIVYMVRCQGMFACVALKSSSRGSVSDRMWTCES